MTENVKVRWLTDHEGTKVAPKTLSSQVYNDDGTLLKDKIDASIENAVETLNEAIGNKVDKTDIVQSDWNQNDETAPDYVKNRTHWVENNITEETIYSGTIMWSNNTVESVWKYEYAIFNKPIIVGKQYLITWNGQDYLLTAKEESEWSNPPKVYVGDFYMDDMCEGDIGQYTDDPFYIEDTPNQNEYCIVFSGFGPHSVVIREIVQDETIHPLDEKYFPETVATKDYVESLVKKLSATLALSFYCIEEVTVITNGIPKVYPANSNVEVVFTDEDVFEIVPTSDSSILALNAYPGVLNTYYSWLEGVKQFSNILFDMNDEAMYSKWSQGNQGAYQVQFAQYKNCIFWSDNPYISDVARRTNYTLCATSELPLCYSTIPENTFKSFYLAFGANSDPNWSNSLYKESFAQATWATQAFSYYGARVVGYPGHDSPAFTITLPKDCRGLMFDARNIECAGTFDATNTTNFGAKSGSWREAFGDCTSLRRLYIKNLKVNLNISWSPIDYNSISYIISAAANTNKITISVSPYTYNLLSQSDFDLATSKNITIALLSTNYVEDKRLDSIANKANKTYVDEKIAGLINSAPETLDTLGELATAFSENKDVVDTLNESIVNKQNKNVIVYRDAETGKASMTASEVMEKVRAGENVYYTPSLSGGTLHPYLEGADTGVFFYSNYIDNDRVIGTGILIGADGTITSETYELEHLKDTVIHITSAERNRWNDTYTKTETEEYIDNKEYNFFILKSSTPGSNKKFKITITDDGILSSEEVVE